MKRLFFSTLMSLLYLTSWAYDAEIDNLYYNLNSEDKTAEVTGAGTVSRFGTITIPEAITVESTEYTVTSIGQSAFNGTEASAIAIPKTITKIGSYAFSYCSFKSVYISDLAAWCSIDFENLTAHPLCEHLYLNNKELTDLVIPEGFTSIKDYVFYDCRSITSVTIPNSVTTIGNSAFSDCYKISSVTIPNSVTTIGSSAFKNCIALTTLDIPNSVISIGASAFEGCTSLSSVTIPNSLTQLPDGMFHECSSLKSVDIPNSITFIGNSAFQYCTGLTDITIPNSVTSIGDCAFEHCSALTSVNLPNSVIYIWDYVFRGCTELTSVVLPSSVTYIGKYSFEKDNKIEDFYYYAEKLPTLKTQAFLDAEVSKATLHVPAVSLDTYKAATQWKEFGKIVPLTDDDPQPTAVRNIQETKNSAESKGIYDISGRRISSHQKGINIVEGKKVIY